MQAAAAAVGGGGVRPAIKMEWNGLLTMGQFGCMLTRTAFHIIKPIKQKYIASVQHLTLVPMDIFFNQ